MVLEFETDQGKLAAPVDFVAYPRYNINPDSLTSTIVGEERGFEPFEVVYREVYPPDSAATGVSLVSTPDLDIEKGNEKSGKVAHGEGLRYTDTTFRITPLRKQIGLHKTEAIVRQPGGLELFRLPVVTSRVPFLASAPSRVVLGGRPVRVFLRCPDESVELTSVISTPIGVNAVVSSPRELTATLAQDAPAILQGTIKVKTTANDRPPLEISVVRYAPVAAE